MSNVNEYFGGKVKSIGFETFEGHATIGVMEPGEYEFGTSTVEFMTVTSGLLQVQLPGDTVWNSYKEAETFRVEKDVRFKVRCQVDTAYLCLYK